MCKYVALASQHRVAGPLWPGVCAGADGLDWEVLARVTLQLSQPAAILKHQALPPPGDLHGRGVPAEQEESDGGDGLLVDGDLELQRAGREGGGQRQGEVPSHRGYTTG